MEVCIWVTLVENLKDASGMKACVYGRKSERKE